MILIIYWGYCIVDTIWNRRTLSLFLGVVLQAFCTAKLVWLKGLPNSPFDETSMLNKHNSFLLIWVLFVFFAKIMGGYVIGKIAENKGFLGTQKFLIVGYILTTCLFFITYFYASHWSYIRPVMIILTSLNVFLYPAMVVLPAIYLMKIHPPKTHVKISMLIILASVIGYVLSYQILQYRPFMSMTIMAGAALFGVIFCLSKNSLDSKKVEHAKKTQKSLPKTSEKILATLAGGVCGAGITHNYFFIGPYALNILILDENKFNLGYLFFYISVSIFLVIASKISDYVDFLKLMFVSLIGVLILLMGFRMFDVSIGQGYILYQVLFSLCFSGFLAPSLTYVFKLFENGQSYFNSLFWYGLGLSLSHMFGFLLSKELGFFKGHFLLCSPLFIFGVLYLFIFTIIKFPKSEPLVQDNTAMKLSYR